MDRTCASSAAISTARLAATCAATISRSTRPAAATSERRLLGDELHRHAVDAVAQAGRRRPVREDVAEMATAAAAMHLVAHHAVARVGRLFDRPRLGIVETRPAGAALEFLLADE